MRASRASAGLFLRRAFALLLPVLAAACGGTTEPPGGTDVAGLWTATVKRAGQLPGGQTVSCSVTWAMAIQDFGTSEEPDLFTMVPFTPQVSCDNGFTGPWEYRTYSFIVRQDGPTVLFLSTSRLDTFALATLSGSTMAGQIGSYFYQSATFRATRRSGPDPNLEPGILTVGAGFPDVEIGDTLRVGAQVADGYARPLDSFTVAWTSSVPGFATVDADGLVHGVSPGTTTILGTAAKLRDSVTVTVLPPAASVAITQAPDSMIVPGAYQLAAVAKDPGGQPLYERRLTWGSSNPAVATVDHGGVVSAVAPGSVTITAHSTVVSAGTTVTVLPAVAQIALGSGGTVVPIGGSLQITATTLDSEGHVLTGRPVHWDAGDGTIISVDADGLTHGVSAGDIKLTVTAENATATLDLSAQMDGPLSSVAAGTAHTCGVTTAGHVYCWGENTVGQLGPTTSAPYGRAVLVPSPEHFESLDSRGSHTCALNTAGSAFCWGYNSYGQLGAPSGGSGVVEPVSGGLTFSRLAAGLEFTCGLASGGSAYCWGLNSMGQLGRGTDDVLSNPTPAAVVGGHVFTSIAAGEVTACGLTASGAAWCWGSNQFGNLGLGTQDTEPHSTPVHAASGLTFSVIAPGLRRTCGLTTGGVVQCWGEGQLTPAAFDATSGYTELDAGQVNFCRVDGSGIVSCWGDWNLGNVPLEPAVDVEVGARHACARLVATGKVVCWGENDIGQLGDGEYSSAGPVEPLGQP
jgi:alpha-tubulin suppressor-like RCC1 family protein